MKNQTQFNRAKKDKENLYNCFSTNLNDLPIIELGIMIKILSNSDDWIINKLYLQKNSGLGRVQFSRAWNNLVKLGYITEQPIQGGWLYIITENPHSTKMTSVKNDKCQKRQVSKMTSVENDTLIITNKKTITNKRSNNNKKTIIVSDSALEKEKDGPDTGPDSGPDTGESFRKWYNKNYIGMDKVMFRSFNEDQKKKYEDSSIKEQMDYFNIWMKNRWKLLQQKIS
jgi:hypothetical protein